VAAVLGAVAVIAVAPALPYALAFAAGAMLYVVIEELIPEAQQSGDNDLATAAALIGFTLMMVLDVSLG
jgi:ZIP family zinc transporter